MPFALPSKAAAWKWSVCATLLLATMINYMDRQTLNQMAKTIKAVHAEYDNRLYARLETGFGLAFAFGAVFSGLVVDRVGVRLWYPIMVLLWSAAGFATGFVQNYEQLFVCRVLLGFFEAANWPCALYTTQKILLPQQRTMGNGILQSGAAVGAIITPMIVAPFLPDVDESLMYTPIFGQVINWTSPFLGGNIWRYPFAIVGAIGALWVFLWLALIRPGSITHPSPQPKGTAGASIWEVYADRRFWLLGFVVVAINATWHFFRVWLPLLMQEQHQYSAKFTAWFTSAYYIATDIGSLTAGAVTLWLVRRGLSIHSSRMSTYFLFAAMTLLTFAAAALPRGWMLLFVLLAIGFGSLGVFPTYYSFTQELSSQHQGKVTGSLSFICWIAMAGLREFEGWATKSLGYNACIAIAGIPPLLGFVVLLFWKAPGRVPAQSAPEPEPAVAAS